LSSNEQTPSDSEWPRESVPDEDTVFRRVHRQNAPGGVLQPSAFKKAGPGISVNWAKYCPTPEHSRQLTLGDPSDNGVVSLIAGNVRRIQLTVEHTPGRRDRSHVTIGGAETTEAREKLVHIAKWEIKP